MTAALIVMLALGSSDRAHHELHQREETTASTSGGHREASANLEPRDAEMIAAQTDATDRMDGIQCARGSPCRNPETAKFAAKGAGLLLGRPSWVNPRGRRHLGLASRTSEQERSIATRSKVGEAIVQLE
jgi:hypothetical protein